ncbi:DUF1254 domain-containing protein [Polynucleobacter necessarius]|uniref:DUF1254 domain-containing protein n=1 Tax=Polynucleobacter necessarius TaxID=576610 RepID=UPI0018D5A30A
MGHVAILINYIQPQENFVACPNQAVVYGAGFAVLDKELVVFQVPDFGDRFWIYALYMTVAQMSLLKSVSSMGLSLAFT